MKLLVLAIMSLVVTTSASAQERRSAIIHAGTDDEDHRKCGLNHAGVSAAVASVMRRNGFQIEQNLTKGINVDVILTPVPISGGCAVSIEVDFSFIRAVTSGWGDTYIAIVSVCRKTALLTGPIHSLQARIRERAIEFTEVCISEEEAARR
jgi:hypothetical protein